MADIPVWAENFRGKCITCAFARPTMIAGGRQRKHEMTCGNSKAITRGLGARGWGGGEAKIQVHKLFGCIYWRQNNYGLL